MDDVDTIEVMMYIIIARIILSKIKEETSALPISHHDEDLIIHLFDGMTEISMMKEKIIEHHR